ncbi:MAG: DUF4097 domain-containing protein [Pseudomonadota bacterium]|nr:DUF4097 domain-containing protein [Pseudomonadota bacterium]
MLKLSNLVGCAALASGLATSAWASTPINESRPLDADGQLSVNNLAGTIEVVAWDRKEVAISGDLGEDVEALEISGDARKLTIHVRYPRKSRGDIEETLLRLQVPMGAALTLEGVSSDIKVSGTRGALSASSVSGDVEARVASTNVKLNSVSGDISLGAPSTQAELQSVSGDINARGLSGTVKAETVSGNLQLGGDNFKEVSAQSVSGDMQLDVGLVSGAELRAETLSGEIAVRLQKTPDAKLSMKTFSGMLTSDLAPKGSEERRKIEATIGSGRGVIELSTFSGDIVLSK